MPSSPQETTAAFEIILAAFDFCLETLNYFRKSRRWPCPSTSLLPEMLFPSQSLTIVTRGGRGGGGSGRKELLLFSEKEAIRAGDRKKGQQMGDGKERGREGNCGKMSSPPLQLSEREIDTRRRTPALFSSERAGEYAFASLRLTFRNLGLNLQQ